MDPLPSLVFFQQFVFKYKRHDPLYISRRIYLPDLLHKREKLLYPFRERVF